MNLYDLTDEHLKSIQELIENGGEVTEEIEEKLGITSDNIQQAALGYGRLIIQLSAEDEMLDGELKRLQARKNNHKRWIESLKNSVAYAMRTAQISKCKDEIVSISFRKSESVEIEDMDELKRLHPDLIKTEIKESPDKIGIKDAIKSGAVIFGATLRQNESLQVK